MKSVKFEFVNGIRNIVSAKDKDGNKIVGDDLNGIHDCLLGISSGDTGYHRIMDESNRAIREEGYISVEMADSFLRRYAPILMKIDTSKLYN